MIHHRVSAEQHMEFPKPPMGKRWYMILILGSLLMFTVWYLFLEWIGDPVGIGGE